ncbi:MAG: nucleotidyltransferase family protein [Acidobacteria bacterium]|nr:nucleotidyltransferase family protein [Acidobacteriota bacterium]
MRLLDELRGPKREAILRIAARHGVTKIQVFGSVARGEELPGSDVDFLIEYGPDTPAWFPGGLIADLEDLLGRRVDVGSPQQVHPLIRDQVMAEARPL